MMLSGLGFLCFFGLLTGVTSGRKKLNLIESRLNLIEIRMNIENQEIKHSVLSVQTELKTLNDSVSEIEHKVCQNRDFDMEESRAAEFGNVDGNGNRVLKGFREHKAWVYTTLGEMGNRISQHETNSELYREETIGIVTGQTEDVKQKVKQQSAYIESLKSEIQNLKAKEMVMEETMDALKTNVKLLVEQSIYCPEGWTRWELKCYIFENTRMRYADAKKFCSDKGTHVVDIQSEEENNFVSQLLNKKYSWLSLTDEETEGQWKWERTGEIATYTNWRPGQPDNYSVDQDCVIIGYRYPYELWNDIPCTETLRVVCKMVLWK